MEKRRCALGDKCVGQGWFVPNRYNQKYCCNQCKNKAKSQSPKYKVWLKAFRQTQKHKEYHKASMKEYRQTQKYKEFHKAYRQTKKYKEFRKAYQQTTKRKAYNKAYQQTQEHKACQKAYKKAHKQWEVEQAIHNALTQLQEFLNERRTDTPERNGQSGPDQGNVA